MIVGEAIYNTLTPGIKTPTITSGKHLEIQIADNISTTFYWKQAPEQPDAFKIYLSLTAAGEADNSLGSDAQRTQIKNAILTYLNNVQLGQQVDLQALAQVIQAADFKTRKYGYTTYTVAGIEKTANDKTEGSSTIIPAPYTLPLARYYYDTVSFSADGKTITPQIKLKTPVVRLTGNTASWTNDPNSNKCIYTINNGEPVDAAGHETVQLTAGQTIQVQVSNTTAGTIYAPSDWSAPVTYAGGN